MAIIYKFSSTTKTTKEEAIQEVIGVPVEVEEKPVVSAVEEQQITIATYKSFVEELLPIIRKAKKRGGLIAEPVEGERAPGGGPAVKFTIVTIASIAKQYGVDKSEIQKIWDMA